MTRDDIIRMAQEAWGEDHELFWMQDTDEALEKFADLVAAAEREACAKVCEAIRYEGYVPPEDGAAADYYDDASIQCAAAIRARGQT